MTLAAAAYNAGEHAVKRYDGVWPYAETQANAAKVLALFSSTSGPFDGGVTEPSLRLGATKGVALRR